MCPNWIKWIETCPVWFELVKGVPAAFVALVIGLIAALIAYRQYKVAKAKLKLDLFDKRYAIFLETWKALSEAITSGIKDSSYGLATPFNKFIPQAGFLFGKEVENYLSKAATKWAELRALEDSTKPEDITKALALRKWFFHEGSEGAKQMFGKYLDFQQWK